MDKVLAGILAFTVGYFALRPRQKFASVPNVGYSNYFLSWLSAFRYAAGAQAFLDEGYRRFKGGLFLVPQLETWVVAVSSPDFVEDMRRASTQELSGSALLAHYLQYRWLLGDEFTDNSYHRNVIQTDLTKNASQRYAEIHEMVAKEYEKALQQTKGDEWVSKPAYDLQVATISRIVALFLVGQPLCDDETLLLVLGEAAMEIFKGRILALFPDLMKPFAARLFTNIHGLRRRVEAAIEPTLKYRQEQEALYGASWSGKPDDLITWLMDAARAQGHECSVGSISTRLLFTSFASIHTTSASFTAALFELCQHPEVADELRKEIKPVIEDGGWSKDGIDKMPKLDSFIKEALRMHPQSLFSAGRIVLKDFTFHDGTVAPKGSTVAINTQSIHHDAQYYPDPDTFKPFRFVTGNEHPSSRSEPNPQKLAVAPGLDYHAFGIGRPACPGRFLAMAIMKITLAHIVLNYDIKLPNGKYPGKLIFEANALPNRTAPFLFRKRA